MNICTLLGNFDLNRIRVSEKKTPLRQEYESLYIYALHIYTHIFQANLNLNFGFKFEYMAKLVRFRFTASRLLNRTIRLQKMKISTFKQILQSLATPHKNIMIWVNSHSQPSTVHPDRLTLNFARHIVLSHQSKIGVQTALCQVRQPRSIVRSAVCFHLRLIRTRSPRISPVPGLVFGRVRHIVLFQVQ